MSKAFEKGVPGDHFENSKLMIAHFPDIMRHQKLKRTRVTDDTHLARAMEEATLRHQSDLADETDFKKKQM